MDQKINSNNIGSAKEVSDAETETMSGVEGLALDIIALTPFDESLPSDKEDPEADFLLGPPTMAPFEVLIEEAREIATDLHQFFAIVDAIFREYESRCVARLKVIFSNPEPFIDWIRNRMAELRHEFYNKETPSEYDRKYEAVCKLLIGEVPDFTTMVDVDVELEGMPMQKEIEEFRETMVSLDEDDRELYREVVKANRPDFWQALENYSDTDAALFLVRSEAWDERDLADKFEYAVKELIGDLEWRELAKRTEHLKQQLKDIGIDLDEEDE